MELRSEVLLMCDYNRWAYTILQAAVSEVNDKEYFANKGLFFKSIHGTLNHLLLVDYFWYGRFIKKSFKINGLDDQLIVNCEEMFPAILAQCEVWRDFIVQSDIDTFASPVCYVDTKGTQQVKPFFASLLHVFNRATHHRGQISAVLTQLGSPAPEMDLTYFLVDYAPT